MGMIYSANVDATVIRLQPLTAEDSEALLEALVGPLVSPFQPALRDLLTRRAAGNPDLRDNDAVFADADIVGDLD